ncbi:MAG TPA: HDOD domain-containing protein [Noviherbaspirillum sp.]
MSVGVTFRSGHRILLASEFFMARRPVLDRDQNLVAHELLFCDITPEGAAPPDLPVEDQPASASVIADVYQHGLSRVIGELMGVLHIDGAAVMSDIFSFLQPEKLVLAMTCMRQVTPAILARLQELTEAGFHFALVINDEARDVAALLPYVEGVRLDVTGKDEATLRRFCETFHGQGKKLLAENVDTLDQFRVCHALGFDFFQGYHFLQPSILAGKKLSPSHMAITRAMALVNSDAENDAIEHCIKSDVALGLNLLRIANTPAFSVHRIDSLRQALMVLGRNQLQRWLQIMLYAEPSSDGHVMLPLLAQATIRGRLMELVAHKLRPGNRSIADTAFTVGIMSLMDTLFSMPMDVILQQIPVVDEVSEALLQRQGYFGKLLSLVEYTEWHSKTDTLLLQSLQDFRLTHNDLYQLQLAAFEWADHVTNGMR